MTAPTTTASFFAISPAERLKTDLLAMIVGRHQATPRHQQVELGPSEIGHPCSRKIAYSLMEAQEPNPGVPRCNPQFDPLPSIIGVATHAWLVEAAQLANAMIHRERWLTETKVHPAPWLKGSADLFDTDSGTVIDWKVPGTNQFALLKANMSPVYRAQVHLYGLGFANAGHDVKRVAIMLLPRGGTLISSHLFIEDYDRAIADVAIERRETIAAMMRDFDVHSHPERLQWFAKDGYMCPFCPWFSPRAQGPFECSGDGIASPPGSYT